VRKNTSGTVLIRFVENCRLHFSIGTLLKAIPRLRLIRQIMFSRIFGNRFTPFIGIRVFFSTYSSAPASTSFCRFFSIRLLKTTTGMLAVAGSCFK
jgi:hypothetical protein